MIRLICGNCDAPLGGRAGRIRSELIRCGSCGAEMLIVAGANSRTGVPAVELWQEIVRPAKHGVEADLHRWQDPSGVIVGPLPDEIAAARRSLGGR